MAFVILASEKLFIFMGLIIENFYNLNHVCRNFIQFKFYVMTNNTIAVPIGLFIKLEVFDKLWVLQRFIATVFFNIIFRLYFGLTEAFLIFDQLIRIIRHLLNCSILVNHKATGRLLVVTRFGMQCDTLFAYIVLYIY